MSNSDNSKSTTSENGVNEDWNDDDLIEDESENEGNNFVKNLLYQHAGPKIYSRIKDSKCDSVESLRGLSKEEFKQLGVPFGIAQAIKKDLNIWMQQQLKESESLVRLNPCFTNKEKQVKSSNGDLLRVKNGQRITASTTQQLQKSLRKAAAKNLAHGLPRKLPRELPRELPLETITTEQRANTAAATTSSLTDILGLTLPDEEFLETFEEELNGDWNLSRKDIDEILKIRKKIRDRVFNKDPTIKNLLKAFTCKRHLNEEILNRWVLGFEEGREEQEKSAPKLLNEAKDILTPLEKLEQLLHNEEGLGVIPHNSNQQQSQMAATSTKTLVKSKVSRLLPEAKFIKKENGLDLYLLPSQPKWKSGPKPKCFMVLGESGNSSHPFEKFHTSNFIARIRKNYHTERISQLCDGSSIQRLIQIQTGTRRR